jgi:hypothetical protein
MIKTTRYSESDLIAKYKRKLSWAEEGISYQSEIAQPM